MIEMPVVDRFLYTISFISVSRCGSTHHQVIIRRWRSLIHGRTTVQRYEGVGWVVRRVRNLKRKVLRGSLSLLSITVWVLHGEIHNGKKVRRVKANRGQTKESEMVVKDRARTEGSRRADVPYIG